MKRLLRNDSDVNAGIYCAKAAGSDASSIEEEYKSNETQTYKGGKGNNQV